MNRILSRRSIHSSVPRTRTPSTAYLTPTHLDTIPHPTVTARLARYNKVSLQTYSRPPFIISSGQGCTLIDSTHRHYLDFSGGIAVNALGHSDPGVANVVAEQSKVLVHNSNLWHNEWAGELAILLAESTKQMGGMGYPATSDHFDEAKIGEEGGLKIFFSNSGTEANEGAIKFARKWGKGIKNDRGETPNEEKIELVSFKDGFHGRSVCDRATFDVGLGLMRSRWVRYRPRGKRSIKRRLSLSCPGSEWESSTISRIFPILSLPVPVESLLNRSKYVLFPRTTSI